MHDALAILAERLPTIGVRLHRPGTSVAIRAAGSADAEIGDASRATIDANGVTRAQASVLLRVVTGQLHVRTLTPSERGALGLLAQLGVVDASDAPTLSAAACYDLLVDAVGRGPSWCAANSLP